MKCSSTTMKALILFLLIVFFFSCGGKVVTRPPDDEHEFTVNGVVVKDMNLGKDIAYFSILRDGNPFAGAIVKVDSDTLEDQGNGNYYMEGAPLFGFQQTVSLSISAEGTDLNVATSVMIPGSFFIEELPANDQFNVGGHEVPVQWDASAQASGYFLSVAAPTGALGQTVLDEGNDRAETISPDAFRDVQGELVEGFYDVYVVAYDKSFVYYPGIVFQLPAGLPSGNVTGANGTIGAGVVAPLTTIEVTSGK
ncbi:MAG: hypothetical protein JSV10_10300 [Candidatus Zixiibacteriota bacterium]|nr:MAG: hypothetical protein JSV10_10300 [candidate division Zixibacteria bacterium]